MNTDRDYILGTHDEELQRLGLQHRVWRPSVLACWQRAGITTGKNVLDIGAGPGYAAVDLAEIVGPAGKVVALERSHRFAAALKETCRARSLSNVTVHEVDLMTDDLPKGNYDFSWCRWVTSFVSDPELLVRKIGDVLPRGASAIFHEYGFYETWTFFPSLPNHERFRKHVVDTWRASGGEPDSAPILQSLLPRNGFTVRLATPLIFCIQPRDYMWQWPAQFIEVYLARLREMKQIDQTFAEKFRAEFDAATADPNTFMMTPLVMEIIAEKTA